MAHSITRARMPSAAPRQGHLSVFNNAQPRPGLAAERSAKKVALGGRMMAAATSHLGNQHQSSSIRPSTEPRLHSSVGYGSSVASSSSARPSHGDVMAARRNDPGYQEHQRRQQDQRVADQARRYITGQGQTRVGTGAPMGRVARMGIGAIGAAVMGRVAGNRNTPPDPRDHSAFQGGRGDRRLAKRGLKVRFA